MKTDWDNFAMDCRHQHGINIIGDQLGNASIGVVFHHLSAALAAAGVKTATHSLPLLRTAKDEEKVSYRAFMEEIGNLPYDVNLFVVYIDGLRKLVEHADVAKDAWQKRLNVAVLFWELPVIPDHWRMALGAFDVILCFSWFVREVVAIQVPGTLALYAPYPLTLPLLPPVTRQDYNIPEDRFSFFFGFDPFSGMDRKCPNRVLEAFKKAFGNSSEAHLVIKLNISSDHLQNYNATARRFIASCAHSSNITVIAESVPYKRSLALTNLCDAYVSLHRSEGLGLGPMEAMLLNKPVIATAWSGNMSYMDARTACLVPAGLVQPSSEMLIFQRSFIGADTVWADPSVDVAGFWMKKLVREPEFAAQLAGRACEKVEKYLTDAARCAFADDLFHTLGVKREVGSSAASLADTQKAVRQALASNRRLRRKAISDFFDKHLMWRFAKLHRAP